MYCHSNGKSEVFMKKIKVPRLNEKFHEVDLNES